MHPGVPRAVALAVLLACAVPAQAGSDADRLRQTRPVAGATLPALGAGGSTPLEQWDRRLASALVLLAADPSASSHMGVAAEYQRLGVVDAALRHVDAARDLAPTDAGVWEARARLWRDGGLPLVALTDAYRAVQLAPASASAANTLGTVFAALGNLAAARVWYRRAIQLDSHALYALSNLCYASVVDPAATDVDACADAVRRAPDSTVARNHLALAYASAGDLDAARRGFADGNAAPGSVEFNMGVIHLAQGDRAAALRAFDAARTQNPALTTAIRRIVGTR